MNDNVNYNEIANGINGTIEDALTDISHSFGSVSDGMEIVGRINTIRSTEQYQDVLSNYTLLSQTVIETTIAELSAALEEVQKAVIEEGAQKQTALEAKLAEERRLKAQQENSETDNSIVTENQNG